MLLVALMYALFATVFTIGKAALETTEPFFLVGSRMAMAGVIALAISNLQGFSLRQLTSKQWKYLILLALFNIYLTNILEFWALKFLPSFTTCFYYSLSPFLAALIGTFFFSERLTRKQVGGLFLGFIGFFPTFGYEFFEGGLPNIFNWAELSIFMAVLFSVVGWLILKQLINEHEVPILTANGVSMFIGGLLALAHSAFTENWSPIPSTNYVAFGGYTLLLMIVSNLVCYNLYGKLLRRFSATFISFAGFVTPLFTALFGTLFLNESITLLFLISFSIVFCGLFLFYQDELSALYGKRTEPPLLEPERAVSVEPQVA